MSRPTRRSILLGAAGAAGAVLLGACSSDDGDGAAPGSTGAGGGTGTGGAGTATTATAGLVLGEAFDRNGLLVAGIPQRAPFLLFEQSGGLVPPAEAPAELVFALVGPDGADAGEVTVARHGDDVDRAFYPLVTTFASTGLWTVRTETGGLALESTVNVNEPAAVSVPQVGSPLPTPATPTTADPLGTTTICTRTPACPFHAVSLADVVAAGRPVAVLISTPAYCQVAICGPVLDLLIDAAPAIDVIHVEVYPGAPPPDGLPTDLVTTDFGLEYEPALFVAGAGGTITSRLDNIYDGAELAQALAV